MQALADFKQALEERMNKVSEELQNTEGPDVKLILLTYMRSGSTFAGDLFNHHPQVFYFYEPLWSLDFHFKKSEPAYFFLGKPMKYRSAGQVASLETKTTKAVMDCAFETMYIQPLMQSMTYHKSISCESFGNCYDDNPGIMGLVACLPVLYHACLSSKASVAKIVRLTMERAETVLKDDPKVKILHLVRDPRGVLNSREDTNSIKNTYTTSPTDFCAYVLQDLQDAQRLKQLYPGRILTARYEDLAERPLDFAARMLGFAGLEMDTRLREYVKNITSSNGDFKEKKHGTTRANSSLTASQWREIMKFSAVAAIDKGCDGVYKHMGYRQFINEKQLQDLNTPAYKEFEKVPGLWSL